MDGGTAPLPPVQRWLCWRCRTYLGLVGHDARGSVQIHCANCGKSNWLRDIQAAVRGVD